MSAYTEHGFAGVAENLGSELGSCPDFIAERLLKEAFIRFCHDTESYRKSYSFYTEAAKSRYSVTDLENCYILKADFLKIENILLYPISVQEASDMATSHPSSYYTDSECLVLSPIPAVGNIKVSGELILVPTLSATGIPSDLYGRYWYTIRAQLFYRIFSLPDCHWTDPERAMFHHRNYLADVTKIKYEAKKHHQHVHRTVRYGGI